MAADAETAWTRARSCFAAGAAGLAEVVGAVPHDAWDRPGLGEWSVRDLVGHASRSLSTVESYLGRPAAGEVIGDPADYYLAVRGVDHHAVAQRGRDAGVALGDDPVTAVAELARRVTALVDGASPDAVVATDAWTMALGGYLPTRTFELSVHTLDLARALGVAPPAVLGPAVSASCELAGRLAARLPEAGELLLLLTGRPGLRAGLSVF